MRETKRLVEHALVVGQGVDVLGEATASCARGGDSRAADDKDNGRDTASTQTSVELGQQLGGLVRVELVRLRGRAHAVIRSLAGT